MFKNIREIGDAVSSAVKSITNLFTAAEYQTELLKDISKFDVDKKRLDLDDQLAEFKASLQNKSQAYMKATPLPEEDEL
jgi:hypothetical protein